MLNIRKVSSKILQAIRIFLGFRMQKLSILEIENKDEIDLKPDILYIEKREGKNRWLHLMCPSGCGETISINLMQSHSPYWKLTKNIDGTINLSPSINKTDGCKSHFFIRKSSVTWI